jgi:PRTRC genetic system protein C
MQTTALIREFNYNGARLIDPSSGFTLSQVRDFYANTYPEIINAEIEGPKVVGERNVYTFRRAVGTKGGTPNINTVLEQLLEANVELPFRLRRYLEEIQRESQSAVTRLLPEEASFLIDLARTVNRVPA